MPIPICGISEGRGCLGSGFGFGRPLPPYESISSVSILKLPKKTSNRNIITERTDKFCLNKTE